MRIRCWLDKSYNRYVLNENPRSGMLFVFMYKSRRQLREFYNERNGYVLSEKKLDKEYKFIKPIFDTQKQKYNICLDGFRPVRLKSISSSVSHYIGGNLF